MNRIGKYILLLMLVLVLTGCGSKVELKTNNSISEENLIKYVKNEIQRKTGDNVDVVITNKKTLYVCTFYLDTCFSGEYLTGANEYTLEVTNIDYPEIHAEISYTDGYIEGKKVVEPDFYIEKYTFIKKSYEVKNKLSSILDEQNNINYKIYSDGNSHDIYIYSSNIMELNDLVNNLIKSINNYWLDIYIMDNYELFSIINENQQPEGTRLQSSTGYDYNLLLNNSYGSEYKNYMLKVTDNGCISASHCTSLIGID